MIDDPDELENAGGGGSCVFTSDDCRRLSEPYRKAFFMLSGLWNLRWAEEAALLGMPSEEAYREWRTIKALISSSETLRRISLLLGIHKALHILLQHPDIADGWVRQPNSAPMFGGQTALDYMMSGKAADIERVYDYLNGEVYR